MELIHEKQHKIHVITDAKSLYDALERSESSTRNLAESRTAIEVTAVRHQVGTWIYLFRLGETSDGLEVV